MSLVPPFPPAVALLSSVFFEGLRTREGQIYFTLMGLVLIPNVIAYFLLYGLAALRNRDPQNRPWNRRLSGTVGVLVFTGFATWGFWARVVDHRLRQACRSPTRSSISPPFSRSRCYRRY
jgi:hypothetical protein